jgi:aspartate kinase
MMTIEVLKFGGSSFAGDEQVRRVSRYVARRVAQGDKLVVVVSALPGATEELRQHALRLNPAPSGAAIDCLIPLADTIGAALVRAALEAEQLRTTTLYGSQLGMLTDANYSRVRILAIDPAPLRAALAHGDVVVVPGGQGRNERGEQTWLGKNSSDLTAVALAGALGLARCEIFSDVCGVYSSDPRVVSGAALIPSMSYDAAIAMSLRGAKVIHHGSVRRARELGVEIVCRLNHDDFRAGTRIGPGGQPAAVVLDERSVVLRFDGAAELGRSVDALRALEVPFVVPAGDAHLLAITCGFFDVSRFLREHRLDASVLDRQLVSALHPGGGIDHHVPACSEARALAQALHDQIHPSAATAMATVTARRRPRPRRPRQARRARRR